MSSTTSPGDPTPTHGLNPIPRTELSMRHARVAEALEDAGLESILLCTSGNLYYMTGLALDSYMYLDVAGTAVWMVKRGLNRAQTESDFPGEVVAIRSVKDIPGVIATEGRLGLELDTIPAIVYGRMRRIFGQTAETLDASELMREVRACKSPWEVDQIRAAAAQSLDLFTAIPGMLAEGRREVEVAADIERHIRSQGHPMMFPVHRWGHRLSPVYLCSGATATLPGVFMGPIGGSGVSGADPHGAGWKRIERNEPVIIDICCAHGGYISDQTVTFVLGRLEEDMWRAHHIALMVRDEIAALMRPGVGRTQCYERAQHLVDEAGLADCFMGLGDDRLNFVGHGLGIEIDEQPVLAPRQKGDLREGMVIAIEPKFFFPGRGAVGVEDTYLVTGDGHERLTSSGDEIVIV